MKAGRVGQLDILVDGRTVISRKGGLIARLVGRPYPEDAEVLTAMRAAMATPS